jgi:hypothetical protein
MLMMNAHRAPGYADTCAPGFAQHVFLVAVRDEPPVPFAHRGGALHPMHVIFTSPGDGLPFAAFDSAIGPLPALPSPQRLTRAAQGAGPLVPREVTGEILRDVQGRLYERIGDHVRPVSQLFTGARGEMIDLVPIRETPGDANGANGANGAPAAPAATSDTTSVYVEAHAVEAEGVAATPSRQRALREIARKLVPEPGLWRLVRFADFIDVITPQLADPRRLQPGHQLACYAQIHELASPLAIAELEEAATRELGTAGRLLPLSYDLCRKLALNLPRPALALAAARQVCAPGMIPAGARFMSLRVALDPTVDTTPASAHADVPAAAAEPTPPPATSPAPAAAAPAAAVSPTPARCSVPEEYVKPWDMRLSRDEALYDMTLATSRGAWQRLVHRFTDGVGASAMKRWHALLSGKTSDQQLWEVTPPRGALGDSRIRRWAEQTLRLGGYDMPRMLVEWEIHWRRRGL